MTIHFEKTNMIGSKQYIVSIDKRVTDELVEAILTVDGVDGGFASTSKKYDIVVYIGKVFTDTKVMAEIEAVVNKHFEPVEPETIEIGDVVQLSGRTMEHEVKFVHEVEGKACIYNKACMLEIVPLHSLTLIRKAPRKHVFEGVQIGWNGSAYAALAPKGSDEEKRLDDIYCRGGRYRMELTEETE
jgi:hypothetical protein